MRTMRKPYKTPENGRNGPNVWLAMGLCGIGQGAICGAKAGKWVCLETI